MICIDASESKSVDFLTPPAVQISQSFVLVTTHIIEAEQLESENVFPQGKSFSKQPCSASTLLFWACTCFSIHFNNKFCWAMCFLPFREGYNA